MIRRTVRRAVWMTLALTSAWALADPSPSTPSGPPIRSTPLTGPLPPTATAPDLADRPFVPAGEAPARVLPHEIHFKALRLEPATLFLRDAASTNLLVNWKQLEGVDIDLDAEVTVNCPGQPTLAQALDAVCAVVGRDRLAWVVDASANVIWLTTPEDAAIVAKLSRARLALARKLPLVRLNNVTVKQACDWVRKQIDVPLDVDSESIVGLGVKATDRISLLLRDVTAETAIRHIFIKAGVPCESLTIDPDTEGVYVSALMDEDEDADEPPGAPGLSQPVRASRPDPSAALLD